jgi:hypothetical protein
MTYSPARPQAEYFRSAPEFVPRRILHGEIADFRRTLELLKRIDNLWNHGGSRKRTVARALLLELLLELLAPDSGETLPAPTPGFRIASRARSELNKLASVPLREAPPVQEYLADNGLTYAHQCRIFKRHNAVAVR